MSEEWFEGTAAERYRDLLDPQDDASSDDADDRVAEVVARARQQLALRDVIALGFGGLVGVVLSLLATVARHLHRRTSDRTAAPPDTQ
ncbi:MAG: hypothetical protein OXU77_05655 [Gammaproteobacteria bacterium]|nr:hypothetical protein [Gammaproteobacteria bacterium]MDE0440990.1 hypothetical protein [Gammaproteobacteria bacterium]